MPFQGPIHASIKQCLGADPSLFGHILVDSRTKLGLSVDFASQFVQTVTYTAVRARFRLKKAILLIFIMATQLSHKRAPESPTIPDRLYFKIGDVARICGLETYVLRFWESQFPQLKPNKSGTGQRLYRRREVELVLEIKRLVHEEGYTLPGARHALEQHNRRPGTQDLASPQEARAEVQQIAPVRLASAVAVSGQRSDAIAATIGHARAELREIAAMLASPVPRAVRRRPRLATVPSNSLFPS